MRPLEAPAEPTIVRRVFECWTVTIPPSLDETYIHKDGYWHARDKRRSVSLTSLAINDRSGRPVPAGQILKRIGAPGGERVGMPPRLRGWAVLVDTPPPAMASRAISGMIAMDGRALIATVTSDDLSWARGVWVSIRFIEAADRGRT